MIWIYCYGLTALVKCGSESKAFKVVYDKKFSSASRQDLSEHLLAYAIFIYNLCLLRHS